MKEMTDVALVKQVLAGHHDAFEVLFYRYQRPLYWFIFRQLHDNEQTADIVQQVFLQLSVSLSTLSEYHSLKSWLYRVARNYCLDELRKRQRRHVSTFSELEIPFDGQEGSPLELIADPRPLPEEVSEARELLRLLLRSLQHLPQRSRDIVLLRSLEHLSYEEIGQRLQVSEAVVGITLRRARPYLKAVFTSQGATVEERNGS